MHLVNVMCCSKSFSVCEDPKATCTMASVVKLLFFVFTVNISSSDASYVRKTNEDQGHAVSLGPFVGKIRN